MKNMKYLIAIAIVTLSSSYAARADGTSIPEIHAINATDSSGNALAGKTLSAFFVSAQSAPFSLSGGTQDVQVRSVLAIPIDSSISATGTAVIPTTAVPRAKWPQAFNYIILVAHEPGPEFLVNAADGSYPSDPRGLSPSSVPPTAYQFLRKWYVPYTKFLAIQAASAQQPFVTLDLSAY